MVRADYQEEQAIILTRKAGSKVAKLVHMFVHVGIRIAT